MCFVFQIPWENTMVYKKTMGEFPWVKKQNYAQGFSPFIIILFPTKYHGCIFLMVKRNNNHGDLVEEVDGHRFSLG
jgi:hypothetical protein